MELFGRYQLHEQLGQGGMGVVYRAHDTVLERIVAIKLVAASYVDDPEMRERFFREARAAGHLTHKNIVTIYDLGEHEGRPYLAMEYLAGENLQRRLARPDRMPLSRRLEVALEICQGVEHAHVHGIVHRDLKPANIFLTDTGGVKILDFGLARPMTSQLTHSNMLMGTLNYMAPEQVRGERADQRADIFSLGVVLYELFSGRKAFEGDSAASTLYKILEDLPEPLPNSDPELPPALWTIVHRALAKNKEDRYQQTSALLGDLYELYQTNPAINAYPTGPVTPRPGYASGPITPRPGYASGPLSPRPAAMQPASGVGSAPPQPAAASPDRSKPAWLLPAVAIVLLAGTAGAFFWARRDGNAQPVEQSAAVATAPASIPAASPVPSVPAATESAAVVQERRQQQDAQAARGRMMESRAAAEAAGAASRAAANFRNAVRRGEEADRLNAAHDFAQAAARYYEASGLFRFAETTARAVASPGAAAASQGPRTNPSAAPAAPETPPAAPPSAPATTIPTTVMTTIPPQTSVPPAAPAAAAPVQREAAPAATPRAPQQPPASPGPTDSERVSELLEHYREALESRSLDRLRQIWPSLGGAAENAIRQEFQHATRIAVEIASPQIAINGASGRVTFVRNYSLTTVDGQRLQSSSVATMTVRRASGGWVIDNIRFSPR